MWVTCKYKETPGKSVPWDCPSCRATHATGSLCGVESRAFLLGLAPVLTLKRTKITCENCRKVNWLFVPLERATALDDNELAMEFRSGTPFVVKFAIVCAFVFLWLPLIPTMFAGVGWAALARKRTRWKTAALVAFLISLAWIPLLVPVCLKDS